VVDAMLLLPCHSDDARIAKDESALRLCDSKHQVPRRFAPRNDKITLRVRFQTILPAYLQKGRGEKQPSVARRTAEGGCPHN
jgi:hypothetical protein